MSILILSVAIIVVYANLLHFYVYNWESYKTPNSFHHRNVFVVECSVLYSETSLLLKDLWNKDTSLIRTLYVVPRVSIIERFHCMLYQHTSMRLWTASMTLEKTIIIQFYNLGFQYSCPFHNSNLQYCCCGVFFPFFSCDVHCYWSSSGSWSQPCGLRDTQWCNSMPW